MLSEYEQLQRAFTTPTGTCWTMYESETAHRRFFREHPTFENAYAHMVFWNQLFGKPSTSLAQMELALYRDKE